MLAESGIRPLPANEFDLNPGPFHYTIPTAGDPDLRARLGERYDWPAEEVLFTCSTQEANFLAFRSFLDGDDHTVVVTPAYQSRHALPETFASVTRVELSGPDWSLDPDRVADARRPETALVVLNDPNNPTGRCHDESTVRAIYGTAADAGTYLLRDEVYRLLAPDPLPPVASLGEFGLSTSGLSKSFGLAGLRFGWLAGPGEVVERAARWKDYTTIAPPLASQHVARQVFEREAELLERGRALADRTRELLRAFLEDHGLDWYEGVGVNAFPEIPPGYEEGLSRLERVLS
jgi:aspartate/methionine/tyrosine aminotransferase